MLVIEIDRAVDPPFFEDKDLCIRFHASWTHGFKTEPITYVIANHGSDGKQNNQYRKIDSQYMGLGITKNPCHKEEGVSRQEKPCKKRTFCKNDKD